MERKEWVPYQQKGKNEGATIIRESVLNIDLGHKICSSYFSTFESFLFSKLVST